MDGQVVGVNEVGVAEHVELRHGESVFTDEGHHDAAVVELRSRHIVEEVALVRGGGQGDHFTGGSIVLTIDGHSGVVGQRTVDDAFVNDYQEGRHHGDREGVASAFAGVLFTTVGRDDRDVGHLLGAAGCGHEARDVAGATGGEADGRVVIGPVEDHLQLVVVDVGTEEDGFGGLAAVHRLVFDRKHGGVRIDRDGKRLGFTFANGLTIGVGGGHRDISDDRVGRFVDGGESQCASTFGVEADGRVVVGPSIGHLTIGNGGGEFNGNCVVVAVDGVCDGIHDHGGHHGDREGLGRTHMGDTVHSQTGSDRDVGHVGSGTRVGGGELSDVAGTFGGEADGRVVVGPSEGSFTFFVALIEDEFDSRHGGVVAGNHVFGLNHDDVLDLDVAVHRNHLKLSGVGGAGNHAADGERVHADDRSAGYLESEDGAFVAGIGVQASVEGGHFQAVAMHAGNDVPTFAFSAFAVGDGAIHVGEVFTEGDVHLDASYEVLVGQVNRDGHGLVEVTYVVVGDAQGVDAGLLIDSADGDVVVGHRELVGSFTGNGVVLTVEGVGDGAHAEARIGSREDIDHVRIQALVSGFGGQFAIQRIDHDDVVEAQQEGTADGHFFLRHREGVGSTSLNIDGIAIPGEGSETVAFGGGHLDGYHVVGGGESGTTEGTVFDGLIGDVELLGLVSEHQTGHLAAIVGPEDGAGRRGGIHLQQVGACSRGLPPVQRTVVTVECHGLRVLGLVRNRTDEGAVPGGWIDAIQFGVGVAERVVDRIHDTIVVDGQRNPVVATGLHFVDHSSGTVVDVNGVEDAVLQTIHGLGNGVERHLRHGLDVAGNDGELTGNRVNRAELAVYAIRSGIGINEVFCRVVRHHFGSGDFHAVVVFQLIQRCGGALKIEAYEGAFRSVEDLKCVRVIFTECFQPICSGIVGIPRLGHHCKWHQTQKTDDKKNSSHDDK